MDGKHPLRSVPAGWRERARELRQTPADAPTSVIAIHNDLASLLERCASELEAAAFDYEGEPLTVAEAAKLSGYSAEALRRAIRVGRLPNAGRPNSPKLYRRDLPRKLNGGSK